jgi:AraC family transcriptional regulator
MHGFRRRYHPRRVSKTGKAMSVTNRALFVIERNLHRELSLEQIANSCEVSRFHLAHAFGESTGLSVIEYVRRRRLTEAARALAAGADDILTVALDACYASHEAFSRAFKTQFEKTPEEVRKSQSVDGLRLTEPVRHLQESTTSVKESAIRKEGELLFVGLQEHVPYEDVQNIAGQWERFMSAPYLQIDHKIGEAPVGVITGSSEDGIEYTCAAGVLKFGARPKNCVEIKLAPATYAVFAHDDHVSRIRQTYAAIWSAWFAASGKTPVEVPSLERHNDTFDPRTGNGGTMIWIPIRAFSPPSPC